MPCCSVYGCKSILTKGCGIHFFKFPKKDKPRRKQWIYYCKRADFTESTSTHNSTLCSKHFSSEQYERDPQILAMYGYENARPKLKNDAIPDIPVIIVGSGSSSVSTQLSGEKIKRGAYEKRRRSEVSWFTIFGPRHEKICLRRLASNKGADQPVHPRSLVSTFVIRILESTISKLTTREISIF